MSASSFCVNDEYSCLLTVCLRFPGTVSYNPSHRTSSVLRRQKEHYSWDSYERNVVQQQIAGLVNVLERSSIEVILIDDNISYPVQHFPRDIGFVVGNTLFVGALNSPVRQGETEALLDLYNSRDDTHEITTGTIEGGDVVLDRDKVFVGLSEETSVSGVRALQKAMKERDIDIEVIPVNFIHGGVLHLDTVFNIIAPNLALVRPSAFSKEQLRSFESRYDLICLSEAECRRVEINTLSISQDTVLVRDGSVRLIEQLQTRGLTVIEIDFSEVCRMPGSVRCATLPLRRLCQA